MEQNFKENLLVQNMRMDASVNFHANGDINILPCLWEMEKEVTDGERVRYRGGIEVDCDGRTRVKRYNVGKRGPMHETLFETAHGAVKMTRPFQRRRMDEEFVYVVFKFPKKLGLTLTKALFQDECDEVMSYLKTRKEETIWK